MHATMEILLNPPLKRVGKFDSGGQKLICVEYLRCSEPYGTVEPLAAGKLIHHAATLLTDCNVKGPTQLYSMFLSTTDYSFW